MGDRKNAATFEAYDGVELRLLSGRVVRCPPLTVREATRFLRLLDHAREGDAGAHAQIITELPERMGLTGERLTDLGFKVENLPIPDGVRLRDGIRLVNVLGIAAFHLDTRKRARAQLAFLRIFTRKLALDADALTPPQVYALGNQFADALYLHIYGLAEDFCYLLTSGPAVRKMVLRAQTGPNSTWASTT